MLVRRLLGCLAGREPSSPSPSYSKLAEKIRARGMEEGSRTPAGLPSVAWITMPTPNARVTGAARTVRAAPARSMRRRGIVCDVAAKACLGRLAKLHLLKSNARLLIKGNRVRLKQHQIP